jgi:hypothetical protein
MSSSVIRLTYIGSRLFWNSGISTLHHRQVSLKHWHVYMASHAGFSETLACLHCITCRLLWYTGMSTQHHMQVVLIHWHVYTASHAGCSDTLACLHGITCRLLWNTDMSTRHHMQVALIHWHVYTASHPRRQSKSLTIILHNCISGWFPNHYQYSTKILKGTCCIWKFFS